MAYTINFRREYKRFRAVLVYPYLIGTGNNCISVFQNCIIRQKRRGGHAPAF